MKKPEGCSLPEMCIRDRASPIRKADDAATEKTGAEDVGRGTVSYTHLAPPSLSESTLKVGVPHGFVMRVICKACLLYTSRETYLCAPAYGSRI